MPSMVAPSLKVTVPVGVPAPELTVAVNVTDCPETEGLGEEASAVLVAANAWLTTWLSAVEVLAAKLVLPP